MFDLTSTTDTEHYTVKDSETKNSWSCDPSNIFDIILARKVIMDDCGKTKILKGLLLNVEKPYSQIIL